MHKLQRYRCLSILSAALLAVLLGGCGQKGDLYLPDKQAATQSPDQAAYPS